MPHHNLELLLARFPERRLLVLGDLMLDRYWWGDASRLSPEAPVPVVRKRTATARPGGAGNTAANVLGMGAAAELIGMCGADAAGSELREALREYGIDPGFVIESPTRPTTTKTRVVALHQHVVRVDEEDTAPLTADETARALAHIAPRLAAVDAVVVSDYAKGFLSPALLQGVIAQARQSSKPVFIDPKGADYARYAGATLLKPNRSELALLAAQPVATHADTLRVGAALLPRLGGTALLVTEGGDGMTLFRPDAEPEHVQSAPRQVLDVTGAGDTVLAAVALSLASGASWRDAMQLAAVAASIAIATLGTAAVTAASVRKALDSEE